MKPKSTLTACALILAVHSAAQAAAPAPAEVPVTLAQDTKGSPDDRAAALVKQMTIAEKVGLLSGNADGFSTRPIARLGIPAFTMSDGPNGVRNGPGGLNQACAFPCGAALAATWNADLATAYGTAMGLEDRARGTNFQLGPGLNICRVPVNGRNFEYFGEDPFLSATMAANWTKACSAQGSVPTIKHFAANNQETNRNSVNAIVDERVMQEIYLPAFKSAVQNGGTVAVMCSYNRLNGSYASNNQWLETDVLRNQWGFKGLVMSDWGASHSPDDILKGLDLEMPSGQNLNGTKFEAAVAAGQIKDAELRAAIDQSVERILRTAALMGWLDAGWKQKNDTLPLDSPDSAKTALNIAREAMVLLKNANNFLPLDRAKVKNIVVLGPNATRASVIAALTPAAPAPAAPAGPATAPAGRGGRAGRGNGQQRGGTSAPNIGGGGSGAVSPFPAHDDEGDYYTSIKKRAGNNINVTYLNVPAGQIIEDPIIENQVTAADAVIVCVGLNRNSEAEGRDRAFDLPADQVALINAAGKANPHTLVINNSGGGIAVAPWQNRAAAIVQAYYLGQEGGTAISEMLFGDLNPSGHLCSTFDAKWEDNPAHDYYPGTTQNGIPTEPYTEGLFYGYRGYDKANKAPLFPFGYGLSYTTFQLSNLKLDKTAGGTDVIASFDLKNTGTRAGAQVVQLYVGEHDCPIPRPQRELKGFTKITVKPGESTHATVTLKHDAFAYWSPDKRDWTTDPNKTFTIEAAFSERDIQAKADITP